MAVKYTLHGETDTFVDGGVLCNYPIHSFDGNPPTSFAHCCLTLLFTVFIYLSYNIINDALESFFNWQYYYYYYYY